MKGKEDEKKSVERNDEPKEQVNETKQVHKNSKKSPAVRVASTNRFKQND